MRMMLSLASFDPRQLDYDVLFFMKQFCQDKYC